MYFGNKILVWGYGEIGKEVVSVLKSLGKNIVAIVDKAQHTIDTDKGVYPIEDGMGLEFDQVVIAIGYKDCKEEIALLLERNGIKCSILNIMYEPAYYELFEHSRHSYLKEFANHVKKEGIIGAVAECGVNNGEFAKYINLYFPDSKCYLFDTFEGFAKEDVSAEIKLENEEFNRSVYAKEGAFAQASEENVIKKMRYPENVIIKKGHFPESADGVDDKFIYVNLDMDLYQPELAGLKFFWNKMVPGGLIMLHDYTHPQLPGVKKAVDDFMAVMQEKIRVQLIDGDCSCAIIKPIGKIQNEK